MKIALIILLALSIKAQSKMEIDLSFEGEKWYSYVIDSTWLGINEPDGNLPRREDDTYRYWKLINGKLQPVIKFRNWAGETMFLMAKKYTVME